MAHKKCNTLVIQSTETPRIVTLWTDACRSCIESIDGVANVRQNEFSAKAQYIVIIDPRYDVKSVVADLRAL